MSKEKRFMFLKAEECSLGIGESAQVLVDKKTGVNYLFVKSGYGAGLTPLLGRDGTPVMTSIGILEEK